MQVVFDKYIGRAVTLKDGVSGVICGFTNSHLLLLLEEGTDINYSFSLDELEKKDYYIDLSFEEGYDNGLYCYADERDVK
jgi:hypothetical protein